MAFRLYGIAVAALSLALLVLWFYQPLWSGLELAAAFLMISPLYLPLLYRLGVILWVRRQRRHLGLPDASDRDLIDFVGEELDHAGIAWQWRLAMRGTTHADEIEIGEDEDRDLTVRVRHGVLFVTDSETGTSRHVDPVAAVDDAISRYEGPKHPDPALYGEDAEEEVV
jgi:hypothetical protein